MDGQWILEAVGYLASGLVAVSLMMSSILRLRLINLLGSGAFAVYGFLIHAYPVAAVNGFIVLINLYYLRQMLRTREYFRLLEIRADSEYLHAFLHFYAREIRRFLPDFAAPRGGHPLTLFILRDMVPAGLLIGEVEEGDRLRVELDFVIPAYRDFKIGRYLFAEQAEFFRARGIREIVSEGGSPEHQAYLRRMGFSPAGPEGGSGPYRLALG